MGISSAAYVESYVFPHETQGEVSFYYSVLGLNESDILQIFLMKCSIGSKIDCPYISPCNPECPEVDGVLLAEEDAGESGRADFYLEHESGLYKVCCRLKNSPYYDCGGDNYLLLVRETERRVTEKIYETVYQNVTREILVEKPHISFTYLPSEVHVNETFNFSFYVYNPFNTTEDFLVYSYSHSDGDCITGKCPWDRMEFSVFPNSAKSLTMSNSFSLPGKHQFSVRMILNRTKYTDYLWMDVTQIELEQDLPVQNSTGYSEVNESALVRNSVATGMFYLDKSNDLNIILVLLSAIGLVCLVWKT